MLCVISNRSSKQTGNRMKTPGIIRCINARPPVFRPVTNLYYIYMLNHIQRLRLLYRDRMGMSSSICRKSRSSCKTDDCRRHLKSKANYNISEYLTIGAGTAILEAANAVKERVRRLEGPRESPYAVKGTDTRRPKMVPELRTEAHALRLRRVRPLSR